MKKKKERNSVKEIPYETIRSYLDSVEIEEGSIKLDTVIILDPKKFYESHCAFIDGNRGNMRYRPYYDRLIKFYNYYKSRE